MNLVSEHADKYAVKAIIRRADGRVLQLRRSASHPHIPFTPDIPGGTLDGDEGVVAALVREVSEETGLDISSAHTTLVSETVRQDEYMSARIALYEVTDFDEHQEVVLSYEHDAYEWVEVADLEEAGFFKEPVQAYVAAHNKRAS